MNKNKSQIYSRLIDHYSKVANQIGITFSGVEHDSPEFPSDKVFVLFTSQKSSLLKNDEIFLVFSSILTPNHLAHSTKVIDIISIQKSIGPNQRIEDYIEANRKCDYQLDIAP